MTLSNYFDRVVCINLDRRVDRWHRFQENVASAGWPFAAIQRFSAVDGQSVPPPKWWAAGRGAWGCHQSHVNVLQGAIQDGVDSLLILEDDAVIPQRFPELVETFLKSLPEAKRWDAIMLGGQHLRPPEVIREGVVRVRNGNRTHAHALRGNYLKDAYQHLCNYPEHAQRARLHVDHRLGMLHESGRYNVYAPKPWMIGQSEGRSDIVERVLSARLWSGGPCSTEALPPFVAVIGLHRSGSSCVTGILHKLGVHVGNKLGGYEPTGGFEAAALARLCERAYRFPSIELAMPREQLVHQLRSFIQEKRQEALVLRTVAGGKYPHLCAMGAELQECCGSALRVLHINRPLEESIRSLKERSARSKGFLRISENQAETVQGWLWQRKLSFLEEVDHLTVEYQELIRDSSSQVRRIIDYLKLNPSDAQIKAAVRHVRPEFSQVCMTE